MTNWLRLWTACSIAMIPSITRAELLNFQCSFYDEAPISVTVDDQARTVSTKGGSSHDLGDGAFRVLKITKKAIWFIAREKDADDQSLKIAVLQRSSAGDPKKGGRLRTAVIPDGGEISPNAPPGAVCWEQVTQKQP